LDDCVNSIFPSDNPPPQLKDHDVAVLRLTKH
jgi:hypothetical protein